MKIYAGIGSRRLSNREKKLCFDIGVYLAEKGWALQTGAAVGADQAFAEGALTGGGSVLLCLPWLEYELDWVNKAIARGAKTVTLNNTHKEALDSVKTHPAYDKLSQGAKRLHARNYLIVQNTKMVLAYPRWTGIGWGGTGQGMRLGVDMGAKVLNLSKKEDRDKVRIKVYPPF